MVKKIILAYSGGLDTSVGYRVAEGDIPRRSNSVLR